MILHKRQFYKPFSVQLNNEYSNFGVANTLLTNKPIIGTLTVYNSKTIILNINNFKSIKIPAYYLEKLKFNYKSTKQTKFEIPLLINPKTIKNKFIEIYFEKAIHDMCLVETKSIFYPVLNNFLNSNSKLVEGKVFSKKGSRYVCGVSGLYSYLPYEQDYYIPKTSNLNELFNFSKVKGNKIKFKNFKKQWVIKLAKTTSAKSASLDFNVVSKNIINSQIAKSNLELKKYNTQINLFL